jgi:hypothetical protein
MFLIAQNVQHFLANMSEAKRRGHWLARSGDLPAEDAIVQADLDAVPDLVLRLVLGWHGCSVDHRHDFDFHATRCGRA